MFAAIFLWDLRRVVYRPWFRNVRVLYALIMLLFFLWHIGDTHHLLLPSHFRQSINMFVDRAKGLSHAMMTAHFLAIFLLTPILAAGPMAQEKTQRTLELLLTTNQTSAEIVLGQWFADLR